MVIVYGLLYALVMTVFVALIAVRTYNVRRTRYCWIVI